MDENERSAADSGALLVEVAWEVCHKLGGIYTVLRSKAPAMVEAWGDRYCLLGPWDADAAAVEFENQTPVGALATAVGALREAGIEAHYGRWLVTGRPQVVLIEHLGVFDRLHEIKYFLWEHHGIELPADDPMQNDVAAFGECCRLFLQALAGALEQEGGAPAGGPPVIAHFHEWMAGPAIPELRRLGWPGTTLFTTHATLLGRYLAGGDEAFYERLPHYDPEGEARRFNVSGPFQVERAAAHGAHVFTTVSDLTARECRHLLGRDPELLLPNGLNIQRFAALHEFQNLHRAYKEQIHQFTVGHFFPSYSFDLDRTIYMFTSGRYEPRNKGMDLTVEALARLNWRLRQVPEAPTVVAFIITRRPARSINVRALQNSAMLDEFTTITDAVKEQVGEKLFYAATSGRIPDLDTLVDEYWLLRLRRLIHAWRSGPLPGVVTHDLEDEAGDAVLERIRACQLWNQPHDPVKVVYHPDFISATNPLFGMEYDQFVRGCHLGVFPSYYEPWGYTPLESIALGIPAVTSDLSGFGAYLLHHLPEAEEAGVHMLRRTGGFHEQAERLAEYLFEFVQTSRRQRVTLRNRVEAFSTHFDWQHLVRHYEAAHRLALERGMPA